MSRGELPPGPASRPDSTGRIDRTPDAVAAWQSVENELDAVVERRVEPGSPVAQALRAQCAAADEVPSAALDASILAAARRAVSAGPRALSSSGAREASAVVAGGVQARETARPARAWWQRAAVPMAAAAMIVLTVSVTTLVEQEHRSAEPGAVVGVPPAPPSASLGAVGSVPPASPSAYAEARTEALPRSVPEAGVPSPSAAAEQALNATEVSRGADHKGAAQTPVESRGGPLRMTEAASSAAGAPEAPALQAAPAAAAAVAALPGPAVAAAGAAAANQGPALASVPEAQNDRPSDRPRTAMTRAQAPVADSAQPAAQTAGRQAADATARPSASAADAEQRVAPTALPPSPRSAEAAGRSARDPDKWLAEVLELRRAGREKDAELALAEFRKVWPHYPLPAALKPAR